MKSILVPLDGSRLAEAVLPPVTGLAAALGASLTLLHVLERGARTSIHGDRHLAEAAEAETYCGALAERLRGDGLSVEVHVHEAREGDIARSIAAHADEFGNDLVALCTHGSSGLRDLLFGSIAQQVLRQGEQPVLLVPSGAQTAARPPETIIVPLDGTAGHEPGLPLARELARAARAALRLVMVIPRSARHDPDQSSAGVFLPGTMRALLDLATDGARDYLRGVVDECVADGLDAAAEIIRGEAVGEVCAAVGRHRADLLVMATHGRLGLDALFEGSVGARLLGSVGCPILLLRAGADSGE